MKDRLTDFGLLVLRLGFGLGIAYHGYGKVFVYHDMFVGGLTSMGFPAPALMAWLASFAEFGGGILIATGIAARFGAYCVAATMLTAAFSAHLYDPFEKKEMALAYLFATLCIALAGPGRYSLGCLFCRCDKQAE